MKNSIYPCIWFDGNAKEAAQTYCSVFPDSRIITDTPMVILLEIGGHTLMGLNGGPMFRPNPSISLMAWYDDKALIQNAHEQLAEAGSIMMALGTYPWSELYSMVRDRYGVCWQLYYGPKDPNAATITPTLMFTRQQAGKAEEAMEYYTRLFPASTSPQILRYGPGQADQEGMVQHAEFKILGHSFAAMDSALEDAYTFDEGVSLVLECGSQAEIDHYWDALTSNGGEESMCGWLKDRYGISWQVIPAHISQIMLDPVKGPKAMAALMKMKKIDIGVLERAGDE